MSSGGGRRVRGGRARVMQGPSSSSAEGPSLEELVSSGIKADTLKQLMTREREDISEDLDGGEHGTTPRKLIALDQITLRGEDLTSEFTNVYYYINGKSKDGFIDYGHVHARVPIYLPSLYLRCQVPFMLSTTFPQTNIIAC